MVLKALKYFVDKLATIPPRGLRHGTRVKVRRPHRITNPTCIRVGNRTMIGRGALIAPILEYAGTRYSPEIEIGQDVYIGPYLYMACVGRITIRDGSVL